MTLRLVLTLGLALLAGSSLFAVDAPTPSPVAATNAPIPLATDPVAAWKQLRAALNPPLPPAEWNRKAPSKEEQLAFRLTMATNAAVAADLAREYATRFPKDAHAGEAVTIRREMLTNAVKLGLESRSKELADAGGPPGEEPADSAVAALTADDPVQQRINLAVAAARRKQPEGDRAVFAEFESQLRRILVDFPKRQEPWNALLSLAQQEEPERGEKLLKEIEAAAEAGTISTEFKKTIAMARKQADAMRKQRERVGKPLELAFKAVDGRTVDLASMKGKVVLIDFWATWCGPCVGELPHVLEAYQKLHDRGFEILGISLDQEKEALEQFTKKRGMPWPQYFDGEGWGNKFAQEFGITGIPAMWLVDRDGKLVDMEARNDLAGKVEHLLAAGSK